MMKQNQLDQYPPFLRDYGSLLSHFNSQFTDLNSNERGQKFALFVQKLVPHATIGEQFEMPKRPQQTNDRGVELESENKDGTELLCIQSK